MIVGSFGSASAWAGRQVGYENGVFTVDGEAFSLSDLLSADQQGLIVWAYAGLREWAYQCRDPRGRLLANYTPWVHRPAKAGTIMLYERGVECPIGKDRVHMDFAASPVMASVETEGELRRRVTATRLLAIGIFAFAAKKKVDDRQLYLVIANQTGAISAIAAPPKDTMALRSLAIQINAASQRAQTALPPAPVVDAAQQIQKLAGLRDEGLLTDSEFNMKRDELLRRI